MKFSFFMITSVISCSALVASASNPAVIVPPIQVIINNSNDNKNDTVSKTTQEVVQTQTQSQFLLQEQSFILMKELYNQTAQASQSCISFLQNHKTPFILATFASAAAYIYYRIHQLHAALHHPQAWAQWQQNYSLEQLMSLHRTDLEKQLLFTIQQQYINAANPTDCISPLVAFTLALQQELAQAKTLQKWYKALLFCKVGWILKIQNQDLAKIQMIILKLTWIYELFTNWSAHANVTRMSAQT